MRYWAVVVPSAALLVVVAGCGRIGFDPIGGTQVDAAGDGTGPGIDAAVCAAFGPWSTPVVLANVNSATDDLGPAVTPDGLTLYFQSFRAGGLGNADLYRATRSSPTGAFGAATQVPTINSTAADRDLTLARGGTRLYFNSDRGGGVTDRIYYSDRIAAEAYTAPVEVPEFVNSYGPYISDDELEAVLTNNAQLEHAKRGSLVVAWNLDGPLGDLNTAPTDGWPSIGANDREIVWESDRTGTAQLFTASRPGRGFPFSAPAAIVELDTMGAQADPQLSADGLTIYFASNRIGAQNDIFVATRSCQ
jgi:hypothetical protein